MCRRLLDFRDDKAIVFGSDAHLFSLTGWMSLWTIAPKLLPSQRKQGRGGRQELRRPVITLPARFWFGVASAVAMAKTERGGDCFPPLPIYRLFPFFSADYYFAREEVGPVSDHPRHLLPSLQTYCLNTAGTWKFKEKALTRARLFSLTQHTREKVQR